MTRNNGRGLAIIGYFKLVKAALLLTAALGLFSLLHRDVAETLTRLATAVHVDPDNRLLHSAIAKLLGVKRSTLSSIGIGTLLYAAVFATEGVGLLLAKRWAEFMTLGVTISFLPIETYELCVHASVLKAGTLAVNLMVAAYLAWLLRKQLAQPRTR